MQKMRHQITIEKEHGYASPHLFTRRHSLCYSFPCIEALAKVPLW